MSVSEDVRELALSDTQQFQAAEPILPHIDQIDSIIQEHAPKHRIEEFNTIDLALLRQGIYELLHSSVPPAVIIDEAVEIAKEYGGEETARFVHGVLGNVVDSLVKKG